MLVQCKNVFNEQEVAAHLSTPVNITQALQQSGVWAPCFTQWSPEISLLRLHLTE